MSWSDVARRDLLCLSRSRMGLIVAAILILSTMGILTVLVIVTSPVDPPAMALATVVLSGSLSVILPLVALLGSYSAIVGERMTGSICFLLGLPNSRVDAFVGKFLSRLLVILGPLTVGLLLTAPLIVLNFEGGSVRPLPFLWAVSVLLTVLFVGLGLTASTLTDTDTQAVSLALGVFLLFRAVWPTVQWLGLEAMDNPIPRPVWYFWIGRINPLNAYIRATMAVTNSDYHPLLTQSPGRESLAVSLEFAVAILLVWTVIAAVPGFVYFRHRDLR